jgi:hypothetical protein
MRFTTYLVLGAALLMAGFALCQAWVLIRRRWIGCLMVYPVGWSSEKILAWERWRLVLGLAVIASWVWGGAAFCLGLLLGPTVALNSLWLTVLNISLGLTLGWLSVANSSFDLSKLTAKQLTTYKMMALVLVIGAFLCPISMVADSYFAPPWGSNVLAGRPWTAEPLSDFLRPNSMTRLLNVPSMKGQKLTENQDAGRPKVFQIGIAALALVSSMLIILFQMQFTRFQNRLDDRFDHLEAQIQSIKSLIEQKK